jgi:hypothetical protein
MKKLLVVATAALLASAPAFAAPGHGNGRGHAYGTHNGDTEEFTGPDAAYGTGGTVTCTETQINPKQAEATCTYSTPVSASECATTSVPFTSDFTGKEGIYYYTFNAACDTQTGRILY